MKHRDLWKKGIAFSMAIALGATGVPLAGLNAAATVYAQEAANEAIGADSAESTSNGDASEAANGQQVQTLFDFNDGIDGWTYGAGWEYQYDGAENSKVEADGGQLKFSVDYTKNKDVDWSQATAVWEKSKGVNLSGVSGIRMSIAYDPAKMTSGSFAVKVYADNGLDANADVDMASAQDVDGGLKKASVSISFDALGASFNNLQKLAIQLIGKMTDYNGAVWIDDVQAVKEPEKDVSVDSTIKVREAGTQNVSINDGKLVTYKKDGSTQETTLAKSVTLVDKKANQAARNVYAYLKAVGASDSVIYGHQNDVFDKAGSAELTSSDTKDVTGSYAGVFGIDALSLVGDEYSVEKYNKANGTSLENTPENTVKAAAEVTNHAIAEGAIATLSAHMPNFANVKENPDYKKGDPTYAKYDFHGYTPGVTTNDPMNQILPDGKYNKVYTAYLDMIADYAKQVNGAILFRPFHENTGSWFWWGAAFCDAQTYKNVFRYTVEYMRDTMDVHNMLYEYGPSSSGTDTIAGLEERYPGDEYCDIVGFDMYDSKPVNDGVFINNLKNQLATLDKFTKKHNKLSALTETGAANDPAPGDNQTALLKSDNGNKDWYNQVLDAVSESESSYYLLWANFSKHDGFYTPYVDKVNEDGSLHGHEMLDNFISFYNDGRTIFAADQKDLLASGDFGKITKKAAQSGAYGYITSPVANTRFLKATTIRAKVTGAKADTKVKFTLKAKKSTVVLNAVSDGKGFYSAKLSAKQLKSLGKNIGTLALSVGGKKVQTISAIYNIKQPKDDPYLIDSFENYYGVDEQLANAWTVNADADCSIQLTLDKKNKSNGSYGLKFVYDETDKGWGGATISKEVDWSGCNALQFYVVPDKNNQKTVIQINANGVTYEAYLNLYEEFAKNAGKGMTVTIPFAEFCERDTQGNPKGSLASNSAKIQSFGLWVNAITDSSAVKDGRVTGTLYYDNITAVTSSADQVTFEAAK